jgi:hypothetical protein
MEKQLWYYMLGVNLLDTMDDGGIPLRPISILKPPAQFVWLSTNPTWESVRSLCPPGSHTPLTMRELAEMANGLYRIGIDPGVPTCDWASLEQFANSNFRRITSVAKKDGGKPKEWRFSDAPIPASKWVVLQRWDPEAAIWRDEPIRGVEFKGMVLETIGAAEQLLGQNKGTPGLVLVYATVDSLAWLNIRDRKTGTSPTEFRKFAETYLIPSGLLGHATSVDLYGARCGLLHTRTPDSDKSRAGTAKLILYAYGNKTVGELQSLIDEVKQKDVIPIHADDLIKSLKLGLDSFEAAVASDAEHSAILRFKGARMMPTGETALREENRLNNVRRLVSAAGMG